MYTNLGEDLAQAVEAAAGLVELVHLEGERGEAEIDQLLFVGGIGLTEDIVPELDTVPREALGLCARQRDEQGVGVAEEFDTLGSKGGGVVKGGIADREEASVEVVESVVNELERDGLPPGRLLEEGGRVLRRAIAMADKDEIPVGQDVAALHKVVGWESLHFYLMRAIPGESDGLLLLSLWVAEVTHVEGVANPLAMIGREDEIGETLDRGNSQNFEAEALVGRFESVPLPPGVFGVDLVICIHPGVDGVLDGEIVGRGHDDRRLQLTHTRFEYNLNYKERFFVRRDR